MYCKTDEDFTMGLVFLFCLSWIPFMLSAADATSEWLLSENMFADSKLIRKQPYVWWINR